jgi:uncharacterized membrane protein
MRIGTDAAIPTGGRRVARRCSAALLLVLAATAALAAAADGVEPQVTVTEARGTYEVSASFSVTQPATAVIAVLTDYEQIPAIMPDVRRSTVLERTGDRAVVEQEAVAKFMMIARRVHVVLDIEEQGQTIRFHDRCGMSFERYEGSWTVAEENGRTAVRYALTAEPKSDVPEFLVKRLLKRDAVSMAERLRTAIEKRR